MKALVIGAGGFVGKFLIEELHDCGYTVAATKLPSETLDVECRIYDMDILKCSEICDVLKAELPDVIFHLAAQSSVALSWQKPQMTVEINVIGSINILEAVRKVCPNAVLLSVGSGEEYGSTIGNAPINEESLARPGNVYAITKLAQNELVALYVKAYGLKAISVRAFNHIGPGQSSRFVISDFCRQVACIEAGLQKPEIYVGNLSACRDFTDVRDIVRAYEMLTRKGIYGETYNVGSGVVYSVSDMLNLILGQSNAQIKIRVDESKLRPVDVPFICADISKLCRATGFNPKYSIEQSLSDIIAFWRNNIK